MTIAVVRVRFPSRAHTQSLDNQSIIEAFLTVFTEATPKATHKNQLLLTEYTPKLVVPQADSKDQRQYIKYKISDTDKGKIRWAKDYEVNNIQVKNRVNKKWGNFNWKMYVKSKKYALRLQS